ncbi:porin [Pseudomonas asiatica]|uniref:porin n=1 Tax=Pseudomonas asiatica TaxID=2219225 RepID=UPI0018A8C2E9|nr:porin [Pseudomonas asiatica]MBF8803514.1 porin [Pseudomonas asiatica]
MTSFSRNSLALAVALSSSIVTGIAQAQNATEPQLSPEMEAKLRVLVEQLVQQKLAEREKVLADSRPPEKVDSLQPAETKAKASPKAESTANLIDEITEKVKIYGLFDYGLTYVSNEGGNSKLSARDGVNYGNRIGLSGSQDLDYGLKAIFTLEHGFYLNDGTITQNGKTWGRQAFAGLQHEKYGTLTVGRQYDFIWDYLTQLNIGGYASTYAGHSGDLDRISGWRVDRSIKYQSPDYDGFKFGVMYGSDEPAYAGQNTGDSKTVSFGATYANKDWGLSGAYVKVDNSAIYPEFQIGVQELFGKPLPFNGTPTIVDQEIGIVGGFYQLGKTTLVANTALVRLTQDGERADQHVYEIGGLYPFTAKTSGILAYQYSEFEDHDFNQFTFGLKHDITPKFWAYASYSILRASGDILANQGAGFYLDNSTTNHQDTARVALVYKF